LFKMHWYSISGNQKGWSCSFSISYRSCDQYNRRFCRVVERELAAVLLTYPKSIFQTLLSDMKALPESIRNKLRQRNQLWIDRFREQVLP
jgi:hypothetical protein